MPLALSDPPTLLYVLLAAAAIGLAALWFVRRSRPLAAAVALAAGLLLALFLCDRAVESDREESQRKVTEMAAAVEKKDAAAIFQHVADDFKVGTADKKAFRDFVEKVMQRGYVNRMAVWDFDRESVERPAEGVVRFEFHAKGEGNWGTGAEFFRCLATFARGGDGQYRLREFKLFRPQMKTEEPVVIPGL